MLDWLCVILSLPYEPAVGQIIAVGALGCVPVSVCLCVVGCFGWEQLLMYFYSL